MKIIFPSVFYLPHVIAGIEMYVQHLALGLQELGHEVKVAVPSFSADDHEDYVYEGIQVIRYRTEKPVNRQQYTGFASNQSVVAFKELLDREQPDIVHFSQLTNASGISLQHIAAAKSTGAKIVYTNHLSEFICQRGDFMQMGRTHCNGLVGQYKCTTCLLQQKGMNGIMGSMLTIADQAAAAVTGKENFALQLKRFVWPGFFNRWHEYKVRHVIATVDRFVSIAHWCDDLLDKNGWKKNNCVHIATGLLQENNLPLNPLAPYQGQRPIRVAFLARLFPVKGPDLLIEAAGKMDPGSIQVDLYGPADTGMYKTYYENTVASVGHYSHIQIHPPLANTQVVTTLSSYDILCMPSRGNEMAPLVIQEAFKAGIPVVGSNLPGIIEFIQHNHNGLIFEVDDAASLQNQLQRLISEPNLLTQLRLNIPNPGKFEQVVAEYDRMYAEICKPV